MLSSLFVLIGAILVPDKYIWLYSTHIILMCLYLMWSKHRIVLFGVLLSSASIIHHEFSEALPLPELKGQTVWFDTKANRLLIHVNTPVGLCLEEVCSVGMVYLLADGTRVKREKVYLSFTEIDLDNRADSLLKGHIARVSLPNKNGEWWEKVLYVRSQVAELELRLEFPLKQSLPASNHPKERLTKALDSAFLSFSSWRYSKALLLGDDGLWNERDTWIIRTLGLAHLFVVSGLHTGFLFLIGRTVSGLIWSLSPSVVMLSGITRWHFDVVLVIPLLFGYAYLTNWGEPVVRAAMMLSLFLCARMLAIKISPFRIITFTLWLVLLIEPRSILSPSLWLSFSMVYLLIGFSYPRSGLLRFVSLQIMLSTASMVLVLGWQSEISSVSILVNVLLVPLAAFIWFPFAGIACVETLIFESSYLYSALDTFLYGLMAGVEWVAFSVPLLVFDTSSSSVPRLLMLCLIVFWVFQAPLKRGWVMSMVIWCFLFFTMFNPFPKDLLSIENNNGHLVLRNAAGVQLSDLWAGKDFSQLDLTNYLGVTDKQKYILSPRVITQLSSAALLEKDVHWVFVKKAPPEKIKQRLSALGVNWVEINAGETLTFHFKSNLITLEHSSCLYSISLFKSDTCRRVENLESVLN